MNNIPKGYKLVPVEPTCSMVLAGQKALGGCVGSCGEASPPDGSDIADAFSAMLAAAPAPPQPIYDEAKERELFESTRNAHTVRRNEHGDYVLPSAQDAWSGWSQCAKSRAKYVEVGRE